jgi:hypothetical protein
MARTPRSFRSETLQYVLCRFIDRSWFVTTELERAHYLTLFGRAMASTDWRCLAYSVMGDQLQFAMVAGSRPLESWAKRVHSPFAQWQNKRRARIGPIFAGRPSTQELSTENALELIAFIHNSAVRANLVTRAADVALSSHRAYLGRARRPQWLEVAEGLRLAGFADRPAEFDQAVDGLRRCGLPKSPRSLDAAVKVVATRVSSEHVLRAVSTAFRLPLHALLERRAHSNEAAARRVAVHVARACEVSLAEMAASLGFSRQRASRVASVPLPRNEQDVVNDIVHSLRAEVETNSWAELEPNTIG